MFKNKQIRMLGLFAILICMSLTNRVVTTTVNEIPKIGIIGGGIGGTSCAFFLRSLFGDCNVAIDLYEADKVGGRLSVVNFSQHLFEEGGSIIHSRNKYMVNFLNKFGLSKRQSAEGYFALYNGKDFVFSESKWQLITLWNVIRRYGFGFWKLQNYIDDMLTKFERIYELQDAGITYSTVGSMLAAMDPKFVDYLTMTTRFGFESQGISKIIVDEIIMATIRANYGQTLDIQKMVGSVSVAGAIGGLWAVQGGNVKVPENLLNASGANFINLAVTSVKRTPSGQMQIKTVATSDDEENVRLYDVVIVATPQTSDSKYKVEFENFEEDIKFLGRYHKTVCTLVEGRLSQHFFAKKDPLIDEILTTDSEVPFNSIGRITPVDYVPEKKKNPSSVWKIFTQNNMSDTMTSQLFSEVKDKYVREWLAYPHYDHSFRNDSFVLAPNLYHINAIEWAASAMEMSVIGAKNVALLAYKYFASQRNDISPANSGTFHDKEEL